MQFKHPEILYALFLLLIPIFIHLFQLRRFEKVPFTNVQFLKKIQLQTRKSSRLKKLLVLCSRLLMFSALILAFAQPFFSKITSNNTQHTALYLDNSLSMQMKGKSGELLKKAIQDVIETIGTSSVIDLYTNTNKYTALTPQELKNTLLSLDYHPKEKDLPSLLLKINTDLPKQQNISNTVFLISDFQNSQLSDNNIQFDSTTVYNFVRLSPSKNTNISLDSVYVTSKTNETISIKLIAKSYNAAATTIPVSLYNENVLVGKSTVDIEENSSAEIDFKIPFNNTINGKLSTADDNLNFDNDLYFSINQVDKIHVLAIGDQTNFLEKIYTNDEFIFNNVALNSLDYNSLSDQNLIVLNELENISESLINSILTAVNNGTHLVIIPNINSNLNSYKGLFRSLNIGSISAKNENELRITDIQFAHPFFMNVFEKSIKNFQYPKINSYYNTSMRNSSAIVNFENETAFISQVKKNNSVVYWLASAITSENSNFKNSPLIVPVFYNFGKYSYAYSRLNYNIGETNEIEIKERLSKDAILTIANNQGNFIPRQQVGNSSVKITTDELPIQAGIYEVKNKEVTVRNLAFNYNREESEPVYDDINTYLNTKTNTNYYTSVKEAFNVSNTMNKTTTLWKFFIIASILFLVSELLLLKFFKS